MMSRRVGGDGPGGGGGGADRGPAGPDVLLTTPRGVVPDMALHARPQPRPGSPLHDYAQRHNAARPASPLEEATRRAAPPRGSAAANAAAAMARSRSLPRSLSRHVERSASFAAGAANGGGGGGGGGAAQRSRVPGARLRALADKSGLPLEPLLQMVADGAHSSTLAADLGLLGLALAANPPNSLDPFKLDGPLKLFNPIATGAAEALAGQGGGGGAGGAASVGYGGGGGEAGAGGGGGGGGRDARSSASGARTASRANSVGQGEGVVPEDEDDEAELLSSRERPEGLDDAAWVRLLEFRQTRAELELDAADAWRRVCLVTAQWDALEAEDAELEAQIEEAGGRAAALRDAAVRLALDVVLTYRLKNGQVELPEVPGDLVVGGGELAGQALALHRNRIEALNEEVLERGEGKIELLETLRSTRRTIHLTSWGVGAGELAGQHAAQRLTELQLLHVTKELQAALRDPGLADRLNDEARLAVLAQSCANLHAHRLAQRRRTAATLGRRLGRGDAEAGELAVAEAAAEAAYAESSRMHTMMSSAQAAEDAAQRRHMRSLVTNAQLKAIAQQQGEELQRLAAEVAAAHARSFPRIPPLQAAAAPWVPPDYKLPAGSGAAAVVGAVAASRPGTGAGGRSALGSRGGVGGGGGGGLGGSRPPSALPLPGSQRGALRPSSQQPRPVGAAGGVGPAAAAAAAGGLGSGALGSRPGSSMSARGSSSSGGAGASLTRAYAAAGAAAGVAGGPPGAGGGGGGGTARLPPGVRPGTGSSRRQ